MTILEALIKLRDDLKTWVANNLRVKADKSYVDDELIKMADEVKTDASNKDVVILSEVQSNLNVKADKSYVDEELTKMVAEVKADASNKDVVILSEAQKNIDTKVDKEDGKMLSSNDFTTEEKNKIAALAAVATSGSYNDLVDTPTIKELVATDNGEGRVTLSLREVI